MAGDRLPSPPRERKPGLAALAALLVLAGALGAAMLVLRAGDRVEAIQLTERVPAGQPIPEDAMRTVMVAEEPGVDYVLWSQRDIMERQGLVASTDLVEGTVLVGPMLSEDDGLGQDQVIVGLALQPGQYPPGLQAGDTVDAYWVGNASSGDAPEGSTPEELIADNARVAEINGEADGTSALSLRLRVDADDAVALARPASDGEVAVVIVPASD